MQKEKPISGDWIEKYCIDVNREKYLFTPGPSSLNPQNIRGLAPCFGRGDNDYERIEQSVLGSLKNLTGHINIVRLQGSASLALEILALNFLFGRVVIVETGFYSDRIFRLANQAMAQLGQITHIELVRWDQMSDYSLVADWIWACPTETSIGLRVSIDDLDSLAKRCGAKLALDATASIGLESGHELSAVAAYSSCKGLFGLTGASFIAYNENPVNEVNSFSLSVESHRLKLMTGPYHAIQSLFFVLSKHSDLQASVIANKKRFMSIMEDKLVWSSMNQPLLCTRVSVPLRSKSGFGVMYKPRSQLTGSVVAHLGEVFLGRSAKGEILDDLEEIM
jgi:aspartate aminotransferase-like enzyme